MHNPAADPELGLLEPHPSPSRLRESCRSCVRRQSPPPPPPPLPPPPPSAEPDRPMTRDGPSIHPPSRPRSTSRPNMVTPEEYEALPPSIQKKYFSSVERLRIARESAAQKRKKQQPDKDQRLSTKPSMDSMRPKTAHSFKPSALSHPQQRRKSFSRPVRAEADVDEEQALRFLALPDKVKRSHFTADELVLLTESSERALRSPSMATDDDVSRRSVLDRNGSVASSHCQSSFSDSYMDDVEKGWHEMETESVDSYGHATETDLALLRMYVRRRQGSACSSHSTLPTISASKEFASSHEIRRKSFSRKRAMSLAPLPLPPPTLTPAVPPLPSPNTIINFSKPGQSHSPTPTETPPSTKYYKDSTARQRVREYLASPEKFEEALEFGFPSERGIVQRSTSVTSAIDLLESDVDNLSITNSKDDDEEGLSTSPKTPSLINDAFPSDTATHSSIDSGVALPFTLIKTSVRSLSPDISGREMTLRMTLTRPDLRAPEMELYSFQRKEVSGVEVADSDPLALEALPVCDDHTGAHGAFAVTRTSKGGFRKAWKSLRGR